MVCSIWARRGLATKHNVLEGTSARAISAIVRRVMTANGSIGPVINDNISTNYLPTMLLSASCRLHGLSEPKPFSKILSNFTILHGADSMARLPLHSGRQDCQPECWEAWGPAFNPRPG